MAGVPPLPSITEAEVIGDHALRLTFDDGIIGEVSFEDRDWRGVFEPLADPGFFAQVSVDPECGTVTWPSGVDMAPEPLYAAARANPVTASSTS
jgi:Protein of unknown function (DUF2442)